jgi:hypothetical protein
MSAHLDNQPDRCFLATANVFARAKHDDARDRRPRPNQPAMALWVACVMQHLPRATPEWTP